MIKPGKRDLKDKEWYLGVEIRNSKLLKNLLRTLGPLRRSLKELALYLRLLNILSKFKNPYILTTWMLFLLSKSSQKVLCSNSEN